MRLLDGDRRPFGERLSLRHKGIAKSGLDVELAQNQERVDVQYDGYSKGQRQHDKLSFPLVPAAYTVHAVVEPDFNVFLEFFDIVSGFLQQCGERIPYFGTWDLRDDFAQIAALHAVDEGLQVAFGISNGVAGITNSSCDIPEIIANRHS